MIQSAADEQAYERIKRFVADLTYRDGWEFRWANMYTGGRYDPFALSVTQRVPDVNNPEQPVYLQQMVPVRVGYGLREDDTVRRFLHELWKAIDDMESHERMEMLQLRGKPVWDPHPERGSFVIRPDIIGGKLPV